MRTPSRESNGSNRSDARSFVGVARALFSDRRGAVTSEYVILVGTIGLAVVFALITVGPKLVQDFVRTRDLTASPIP